MTKFNENIINLYGDVGRKWLSDLSNISQNIAKKHHLTELKPLANLTYNYVMTGIQTNQQIARKVILKLSFDNLALDQEIAALKVFSTAVVPEVILAEEGVLILEQLTPGQALNIELNNVKIACETMQLLHQNQANTEFNFPHIKKHLEILEQDWPGVPLDYLVKARQLRDQSMYTLFNPAAPTVLLHGDLHYGNILRSDNGWKAIDPKGIIGHPLNEIWAFVMDIENDTNYIANFFGFELQLVRSWYFIHLIIAICHNMEDNTEPTMFLQLAQQAYSFLN